MNHSTYKYLPIPGHGRSACRREYFALITLPFADVDPLPSEDVAEHDQQQEQQPQRNGHNDGTHAFTQIGINVTNEAGQVHVLDGRFVVLNVSIVSYVISATSFLCPL